MSRRRGVLGAAALALLVASCTQREPGAAVASSEQPPSTAPGLPSSTAATTTSGPSRPRTVDVTGVDPCGLITDSQRAQLGLDARPQSVTGVIPGSTQCAFASRTVSPFYGVLVSPARGVSTYSESTSTRTSTPTTVAGFPAYTVTRAADANGCVVVVDVADGQLVQAQRDDRTGTPVEQICASATSFADDAMQTLLAQR